MSREDDFRRISEMAGVDEDGGIIPPENIGGISRIPSPSWTSNPASIGMRMAKQMERGASLQEAYDQIKR